jgi:hypothetical protein
MPPSPVDEVEICAERLENEEKFMSGLYDDATDLPVKAASGNATIGFGCNVQAGWSLWLARGVLRLQIQEVQMPLANYTWYQGLNAARRSVMLDVGFNDGVGGLLQFHQMIDAIVAQNWPEAAAQCHVKNPKLAARYEALAQILLTGVVGG